MFGNHIDTHQETKLKLDKDGKPESLSGFLYVIFTGVIDVPSGLPIAIHPRGVRDGFPDEVCGESVDCVKGWDINGVPAKGIPPDSVVAGAKFLYHSGVNGDDHAVWMLNREDIPQPGSYTHFHWIARHYDGLEGTIDPRTVDVPPECDQINAGALESEGAANVTCPGWLLEIKARIVFAFEHGGEIIPVLPGIDNASHLNLVTNYAVVEDITGTRPPPPEE